MAKSSQHFYLGSARTLRAGDRALAITNFRVLSTTETHEMDGNVVIRFSTLVASACPLRCRIANYS